MSIAAPRRDGAAAFRREEGVRMAHGAGLSNVLTVLKQHGAHVRSHGCYYTVQCPAHDDRTASLSISQGEKGAVLNCHAGCETDAIRVELGLNWPDLFDNGGKLADGERRISADLWMPCQPQGCGGHKVAEYRYTDENGVLLYAVARCSRKGDGCPQPFAQWHPDSSKKHGKKWGLPGNIRRVVYNLPSVLDAARSGRRIWLMEGEKDADRMKNDFPEEVATSAPSGAGKNKWRLEYTRCFAGASEVIIVADCDKSGLEYAEEVHHHLGKVVNKVTVVCTPLMENGADFSDHRNYGFSLDDFEVVPFATVERRPRMVIEVEDRHREKPVLFDGYSQEGLERALIGAMLKYGMHYSISQTDMQADQRLHIVAGAIGRIAAEGNVITPETVAIEVEARGQGSYESVLEFLHDLERSAFSDTEKPKKAARTLRERTIRRGIAFVCRATEEAVQKETRTIDEVLNYLANLANQHAEEYAQLDREYGDPVGDVFTGDVVKEVASEEEIGGNVHELRPAAVDRQWEAAAQRG